ncbi:MAG: ribonuclease R [Coxiellaceae bacterium]|nr:ribonuclease R [Coxiellaceae bacterium]
MVKKFKKKDPHYQREKKKYADPLPSREFIIDHLEEINTPCSPKQLAASFGLKNAQLVGLNRRLRAMERDGQLRCNRKGCYGLLNKLELVHGTVQAHRDGFGFLLPDDDGQDIFLPTRQMNGVFNGDSVVVRVVRTNARGRREGAVVEVLEHNTKQLVGKLCNEGGIWFVSPDSRHMPQDVLVSAEDLKGAEAGQFVVIDVIHQPQAQGQARVRGEVCQILGDHLTIGMEVELALRSHQIPHEWPKAVEKEAKKFKDKISKAELARRCDLRDLPFVTIDGEDARDFDDAVLCQPLEKGGWRVYVAIADVAHYVQHDSAIDQQASERGNSVYFPARVIPMLPEVLSNQLCSLMPKVDRLAMVCEMTLDKQCRVQSSQFYNGVIHSHARLTYNQVNEFLHNDGEMAQDVQQTVKDCYAVFQSLLKQRKLRGAIDFETIETQIQFGKDGKIDQIVPVQRNDAHRLIEELMLLANKTTAEYLLKHNAVVLYRNHERPEGDKLEGLRDFLKVFGLRLSGGGETTAMDYSKLLSRIHGRKDSHLLQTVLLRSLKQAKFETENKGHFGLSYDAYCQFTSPIRRYPDLIIHRAIKYITSVDAKKSYPYTVEAMAGLGEHYSNTERRADKATRDSVDWLKCYYMKDKVGETYKGIISDVTSFGLFVQLENIYVEGLVHIATLKNDYYHHDSTHHLLRAKKSGKTYQLGDEMTVLVAKVSVDDRRIDFDCVD